MVAINSLTDRLIEMMCQYGSGETALGGGPASKGYRVYHLPYDSYDSVLDGSLALTLSNHLRCISTRMKGDLNVRVQVENLWDLDRCRVRVEIYEVYATREEAIQRERELLRERHRFIGSVIRQMVDSVQEQVELVENHIAVATEAAIQAALPTSATA